MKQVLVLIAARAGSQELRHKNIRKLAGKPLLVRAVELGRAIRIRGVKVSVVVSTDSRRYANIAVAAGAEVPFLRPAELAHATARLSEVVVHAIHSLAAQGRKFDTVVLLSATTPLTRIQDVHAALRLHFQRKRSVASVVLQSVPTYFDLQRGILMGDPEMRIGRRQEQPARYTVNGAIYVASTSFIMKHHRFVVPGRSLGIVMPRERSIDIENYLELKLVRFLLRRETMFDNKYGRR